LGLFHVYDPFGVVAKNSVKLVNMQVHRAGLNAIFPEGLDFDPASGQRFFN
jgi:hypothetical protein